MNQVGVLSKYTPSFINVIDAVSEVINKTVTTHRIDPIPLENGAKISYHLERPAGDDVAITGSIIASFVFHHNKDGVFTSCSLENDTEVTPHFPSLLSDVKNAIQKYLPKRASGSKPPTELNVFDEVLKRLEMMNCTELATKRINYGCIFKGLYAGDTRFEFNIHIKADGHLNQKPNKKNPVWNKPREPPLELRNAVSEVVEWCKRVEANGGREASFWHQQIVGPELTLEDN